MTAPFLSSELSSLIAESKRKLPELRNAAEKSLSDLKLLTVTSDTQLSADLSRKSHFVEPFIIACSSNNSRFAISGASCLQRLAVTSAIAKERLGDVIDGLRECSSLGLDVQLKILQTLTALTSNYSDDVKGEALFTLLQICASLQTQKNAVVSSTAAATLQQLVTALLEKVGVEDKHALEVPTVAEVPGRGGKVPVRAVAYDAFRVFSDICSLLEDKKPSYIRLSTMPEASLLELVESILSNHVRIVRSHPELCHILRTSLVPHLLKLLAEKQSFPTTIRAARLLRELLRYYLDTFPAESEAALALLVRLLETDTSQTWKRVLPMEIFRVLFADYRWILQVHAGLASRDSNNSVLRTCLASFVRIASEKPASIGLSQQSTIPVGNYFQRDTTDLLANINFTSQASPNTGINTAAVPGISQQWGLAKIACIDQLDKTEPPNLPETYPYTLVLLCLNGLSDALAKFIIPLTVPVASKSRKRDKAQEVESNDQTLAAEADIPNVNERPEVHKSHSYRKRTVPENPLQLEDHPASNDVRTAAAFVEDCWPAILACCSTFLYASLDHEYYRSLIRAYQKFTQVIGLLRMSTPRDAFMTTLGKAAVPSHVLSAALTPATAHTAQSPAAKSMLSVEGLMTQATNLLPERNRRTSLDTGAATLNSRNLLCLRALVNLAIALGPILSSSWSIIFETLQQADNIMAVSISRPQGRERSPPPGQANSSNEPISSTQAIGAEVAAVQAATSRLFESTVDFPNDAFRDALSAICDLLLGKQAKAREGTVPLHKPMGHQRRVSSFSGISVQTQAHEKDPIFALAKIREISSLNLERFIECEEAESGWNILVREVASLAIDTQSVPAARLLAADMLARLARDSLSSFESENEDQTAQDVVQSRALHALLGVCKGFQKIEQASTSSTSDDTTLEAHAIMVDSLRVMLEHAGQTFSSSWRYVFGMIQSVISRSRIDKGDEDQAPLAITVASPALAQSAFSSLQLICSDFLSSLPENVLLILTEVLCAFAEQQADLNISLTTETLFWNLSDYLYSRTDGTALHELASSLHTKAQSTDGWLEEIQQLSKRSSLPALWFHSTWRLVDIAKDPREEVRNGAIQTALRIFSRHGEELSPLTWNLCIRRLWLRLLSSLHDDNIAHFGGFDVPIHGTDSVAAVQSNVNTLLVLLQSISKLLIDHQRVMEDSADFHALWDEITSLWISLAAFGIYELSAATFTTLTRILSQFSANRQDLAQIMKQPWKLWLQQIPRTRQSTVPHDAKSLFANNQKSYEAYAMLFKELYKLEPSTVDASIFHSVCKNFLECMTTATCSAYSSDVDNMTALQTQFVSNLRLMQDRQEATITIVNLLSEFLRLANGSISQTGKFTFVALSKASMELLVSFVDQHITNDELLRSRALRYALRELETSISSKYTKQTQGKAPALWRVATEAALTITSKIVPRLQDTDAEESHVKELWTIFVRLGYSISAADVKDVEQTEKAVSQLIDDEAFDLCAFDQLQRTLIPHLGSPQVSDQLRRAYARGLFENSLIHLSDSELPLFQNDPLKNLYTLRYGSTLSVESKFRYEMSYACLRGLQELVSVHDGSAERVKLAQAAAPYLILRAATSLKTYIVDQPLRGRMPQPYSERVELLTILRELKDMDSEPKAIPNTDGASCQYKKHVLRLYPLLSQAVGVAIRDPELVRALQACLDSLSEEFGVE